VTATIATAIASKRFIGNLSVKLIVMHLLASKELKWSDDTCKKMP